MITDPAETAPPQPAPATADVDALPDDMDLDDVTITKRSPCTESTVAQDLEIAAVQRPPDDS